MVAQSVQSGPGTRETRGRTRREQLTPEQTNARLEQRIRELETELANRPQQPAPAPRRIRVASPEKFTGDQDGQQILYWLSSVETAFRAEEYRGVPLDHYGKITLAISYLDTKPRRRYNSRVAQQGEFATYELFDTCCMQRSR